MSKQITITIPDKIYESLTKEGDPLEEGPSDVVKRILFTAYTEANGAYLNLRQVVDPTMRDHPDLFLPSATTAIAEPSQKES